MSALSAEGYWHYHPSDVSTTTRMMSLLSCVKYSKPLSCMSKTIRATFLVQYHHYQSGVGIIIQAMSALSSEQCHHYHQADVRHISTRLSAFLMAFLFALPIVCLGILQIKVPNTTSPFTNYLYSTRSFPFVDFLSSTNYIFSDSTFYSFWRLFMSYKLRHQPLPSSLGKVSPRRMQLPSPNEFQVAEFSLTSESVSYPLLHSSHTPYSTILLIFMQIMQAWA